MLAAASSSAAAAGMPPSQLLSLSLARALLLEARGAGEVRARWYGEQSARGQWETDEWWAF
jgi:hypothetical protein